MFPFFKRFDNLMKLGMLNFSALSIEGEGSGDAGGEGGGAAAAVESPGLLDRDSRVEAALEMFEGDGADEREEEDIEDGGEEVQQTAEEKAASDKAAADKAAAEGKIPDEQLQKDPRYQALDNFQKEHKPIFEKYGVPNAKELDLQLADSAVLYQIMEGKGTPSQLLETMAQAGNWSKEQQQSVANDLIGWLTKAGYLKEGQGGQARGTDGKFKDPLEERLDKLQKEREDEKRADSERKTADRKAKIFDTYRTELGKLAKEKNIDPADLEFYGQQVRLLIQPGKEFETFTSDIEKGNFVKLREVFAQVYNREVDRLKRFTNATTKTHERRVKSAPRVPAGGAPPAPAGQQKRNLSNRDERLAAAQAEWNK